MKRSLRNNYLLFVLVLLIGSASCAQNIVAFRNEDKKWGFKKGDEIIIEPQYDSTFGFDATQKIALVANLNPKKNFINPLTRELKKVYDFYYITDKNKKLFIILADKKTVVMELPNQQKLQKDYLQNLNYFKIYNDGKYYLFSKSGEQISGGFDNIYFTNHASFFITETKDKSGTIFLGLIDDNGKSIVPSSYSSISVNINDSLIVCCTAGIKASGNDDVYNYKGEKKMSYGRHIDYVTKEFIAFKIYEPVITFIIQYLNIKEDNMKHERILKCEKVQYLGGDELLYKQGKNWYLYTILTEKKVNFDPKLYPSIHLNE